MKNYHFLILVSLTACFFCSCAAPFDKAKAFNQAKSDCYQQDVGLCDKDIQNLRDHGDDEDAGIAAGYRVAGH